MTITNLNGALPHVSLHVNRISELKLTPLPVFGTSTAGTHSFSFISLVKRFLFAPLPPTLITALAKLPSLAKVLRDAGLVYAQDLALAHIKPLPLPTTATSPGLFTVEQGTTTLSRSISADDTHQIIELVRATPAEAITIALPTTKKVTAAFNGQIVTFVTAHGVASVTLDVPTTAGRYFLTTSASPLSLAIDVVAPPPPPPPKSWLARLFGW